MHCFIHEINMYPLILGALEDFETDAPSTTKQSSVGDCQNEAKPSCSTESKVGEDSSDTTLKSPESSSASSSSQDDSNTQFEAQFAKMAEDVENTMKTMLGDKPELVAQLDQFAQAAANAEHGKALKQEVLL